MLNHLARCCNPIPGDDIVGYITRSRGVTVHRTDCHNVLHEDEKERLVRVGWGKGTQLYLVGAQIEAWDRVGLLRDISALVAEEKVNIASATVTEHDDRTASVFLSLEIKDILQLSRILNRIEGIRGVLSAARAREPIKNPG
jgi:GTP pyrophosphokinase